ncbi:hypothetical protein R3P38DRAFT_3559063 [Favolaschia claudopus]|uniref:Uncharacterized protein n=1 Tax=Favolaschia claudopus TaxID=2862362 RepID=A0AAW0B071_9AGAR
MPEQQETASSGKVAKEGIKKALEEDADLTLEGIYANATTAEAEQEDASERAQSGLVYELSPASTIVGGSESHQTSVYPEVMKYDIDNNYPPLPYPPSFKRLVLTGVQTTHRALILNLGMLNLMLYKVSVQKYGLKFLRYPTYISYTYKIYIYLQCYFLCVYSIASKWASGYVYKLMCVSKDLTDFWLVGKLKGLETSGVIDAVTPTITLLPAKVACGGRILPLFIWRYFLDDAGQRKSIGPDLSPP